MTRKVCVVTGTRADYGLLRKLMRLIFDAPELLLQVAVTGMHLSPEFGLTYQEIEKDGFFIDARIETLLSSDTGVGVAKAVGLGVLGFADAFDRLEPDIVVVLGDRFEAYSAVQAAFLSGISIAHISGGEVTTGALDDSIRHSISKMARFHFVASEVYRKRVLQLGENPEDVENVGDPALDNIADLQLPSLEDLCDDVGVSLLRPYFLVTYHPTTNGQEDIAQNMHELFSAFDNFPDHQLLWTKANADAGGRTLNKLLEEYARTRVDRVSVVTSLGSLRYLAAMKYCDAVVGNSSSGIVEAPAMGVATINIGRRQDGRLKATSIVDCTESAASITKALEKALSVSFKHVVQNTRSLYGTGHTAQLIVKRLKEVQVNRYYPKQFHDLHG